MALLPENATPYEIALSKAIEPTALVESGINAMRRIKHVSPRPSMLPFLVWEYGLGELTPYVPNLYQLIDQGVRWQRLRGTVSAVAIGLGWIGYTATIEEEWTGRTWWNSFQLRFPQLPAQDDPDLERIEGITRLSVPLRSQLRRGVHYFDVDAVQLDHNRLDDTYLDFESGIAVTDAGTLWSFGRPLEFEHELTEAEGSAIGNWIAPVGNEGIKWVTLTVPWVDAHYRWAENPAALRRAVMAGWFVAKPLWMRLRAQNGAVIGFRRCRAVSAVQQQLEGPYAFGGGTYEPAASGQILFVEAMTDFDDAAGVVCTEIALIVGATMAPGVKPGRLWLGPDQLLDGEAIAVKPVSTPLRRTVREQIKFLMRY
ncbi:MAG: phage tail protein [Candidatus Devosia phytovorans]|uniref:Phage tail protein n=1 Tax=Candidatus Devosia phytovorans TaxID=3121372 RepID=A0AAJ6AZG8_9HYPH|nr:phage tail protein [Devosia sp.]WEK04565.1 MAG: phage tail protein [Devosia sp.]